MEPGGSEGRLGEPGSACRLHHPQGLNCPGLGELSLQQWSHERVWSEFGPGRGPGLRTCISATPQGFSCAFPGGQKTSTTPAPPPPSSRVSSAPTLWPASSTGRFGVCGRACSKATSKHFPGERASPAPRRPSLWGGCFADNQDRSLSERPCPTAGPFVTAGQPPQVGLRTPAPDEGAEGGQNR